jgi:hypothetical protein
VVISSEAVVPLDDRRLLTLWRNTISLRLGIVMSCSDTLVTTATALRRQRFKDAPSLTVKPDESSPISDISTAKVVFVRARDGPAEGD